MVNSSQKKLKHTQLLMCIKKVIIIIIKKYRNRFFVGSPTVKLRKLQIKFNSVLKADNWGPQGSTETAPIL